MYKRQLYRCGRLSLEPDFSEQWFFIIFGVAKSYYLFAFYDHHQLPPESIFLNGKKNNFILKYLLLFYPPKESLQRFSWWRIQQPLLLAFFVCFLWCIFNNSLATVKNANEGEKVRWESFYNSFSKFTYSYYCIHNMFMCVLMQMRVDSVHAHICTSIQTQEDNLQRHPKEWYPLPLRQGVSLPLNSSIGLN